MYVKVTMFQNHDEEHKFPLRFSKAALENASGLKDLEERVSGKHSEPCAATPGFRRRRQRALLQGCGRFGRGV